MHKGNLKEKIEVTDADYSQEPVSFRDNLLRFLADRSNPSYRRERCSEPLSPVSAAWRSLVDLGISGLLVPKKAGDLGAGLADIGVVMEEFGRRVQPMCCWASVVGATSAAEIFASMNPSVRDLLDSLADGSRASTLALEESDQRFLDWPHPQLSVREGKLQGEKVRVPDALVADFFFVTALDGVYLAASDAPGLRVEPIETIDDSPTVATVLFDQVSAERVGDVHQLAPVIDRLLVALSADTLGAAEVALQLTLNYAKEGIELDRPIDSFQAIQHLCAEMLQSVEMGRAGLHYALRAVDEADAEQAHRAAVMVKAYMSETFPRIAEEAIQIFAGVGSTGEQDIHSYYKRLLSLELTYGSAAQWMAELSRIVVDKNSGLD